MPKFRQTRDIDPMVFSFGRGVRITPNQACNESFVCLAARCCWRQTFIVFTLEIVKVKPHLKTLNFDFCTYTGKLLRERFPKKAPESISQAVDGWNASSSTLPYSGYFQVLHPWWYKQVCLNMFFGLCNLMRFDYITNCTNIWIMVKYAFCMGFWYDHSLYKKKNPCVCCF